METSRLELFADAVFAIAATLLIVDVSVDAQGGALGAALEHSWPQYAAYAVSFVTIGIWWVNHHAFLAMIGRADRTFLFANIGGLACIAFLPFPTGLVAEHFRDNGVRAAVITYGLTMTAAAICFGFGWFYATSGRRLIAGAGRPARRQRPVALRHPGSSDQCCGDARRALEPVHGAPALCGARALLRRRQLAVRTRLRGSRGAGTRPAIRARRLRGHS